MADPDKPGGSDEDALTAFRNAVADARPLHQDKQPPWRDKIRTKRTRAPETAETPAPQVAPINVSVDGGFHRGGLQRSVLRKLRQGQIRPGLRMDLHGYRLRQAEKALERLISTAMDENIRVILVIHGKGVRSEEGIAVLKQGVHQRLAADPRVLAFYPAIPRDGGSGASYVYLKSPGVGAGRAED